MRGRRAVFTTVLLEILVLIVAIYAISRVLAYYSEYSGRASAVGTINSVKDAITEVCSDKRTEKSVQMNLLKNTALLVYSCTEIEGIQQIGPMAGLTRQVGEISGWDAVLKDCAKYSALEKARHLEMVQVLVNPKPSGSAGYALGPGIFADSFNPIFCPLHDFTGSVFEGGAPQIAVVGVATDGKVYFKSVAKAG
jgi:hypothetical protein